LQGENCFYLYDILVDVKLLEN